MYLYELMYIHKIGFSFFLKENNLSYTDEELQEYSNRKKAIYKWYKYTNEFINKIESLDCN